MTTIPLRNQKGNHYPKISEGLKRHYLEHPVSEETLRKLSESHMGQKPWNKGIPMTEEQKRKDSETHKGKPSPRKGTTWSPDLRQRLVAKHRSKETRERHSEATKKYYLEHPEAKELHLLHLRKAWEANKGKPSPLRGRHHSEETRVKMSLHSAYTMKGKHLSQERRKRLSEFTKGMWLTDDNFRRKVSAANKGRLLTEEHLRKIMLSNHVKPNKKELQLGALLNSFCPSQQFRYVGDGQVIIDGLCPDFVNDKRQILELFGQYWHSEKRKKHSREEEEQRRIQHFAKFGYKTLIVWEAELCDPAVLREKIMAFVGSQPAPQQGKVM